MTSLILKSSRWMRRLTPLLRTMYLSWLQTRAIKPPSRQERQVNTECFQTNGASTYDALFCYSFDIALGHGLFFGFVDAEAALDVIVERVGAIEVAGMYPQTFRAA